MASFRDFGYEGRDGTCLWCGRTLGYERYPATDADQGNPTYQPSASRYQTATIRAGLPGYLGNGFFDTASCGFQFGKQLAALGRRLQASGDGS